MIAKITQRSSLDADKATYKPPRHEQPPRSFISVRTTTRQMRRLRSDGWKTGGVKAAVGGGPMGYDEEFPPLISLTLKQSATNAGSHVPPRDTISTITPPPPSHPPPSSPTPTTSSPAPIIEPTPPSAVAVGYPSNVTDCIHLNKKAKRSEGGGHGADGKESEKKKEIRFSQSVLRIGLAIEEGNEDTHRRVLGDEVERAHIRITRPTLSTTTRSPPFDPEIQSKIDEANEATKNWSLPIINETIESVYDDENTLEDSNAEDPRFGAHSDDEIGQMLTRDMFHPQQTYNLPIYFMDEEMLPLMNVMEWIRRKTELDGSAPGSQRESDLYLGQDAIFAGLLKILKESESGEYAIGYPIDVDHDLSMDDMRQNVVRKEGAQWIIQPILISHHWILGCCQPSTSSVVIYDSLAWSYDKQRKDIVKAKVLGVFTTMLNRTTIRIKYARSDYVAKQSNGYQCGVFVLIHARRFAQGRRKLVGQPTDIPLRFEKERKDLLALMMCLQRYISNNYDVDDGVQAYDEIALDFDDKTVIRTSPRDISAQLLRIREIVQDLNKGRAKKVTKRRKAVKDTVSLTTPIPVSVTLTGTSSSPPAQVLGALTGTSSLSPTQVSNGLAGSSSPPTIQQPQSPRQASKKPYHSIDDDPSESPEKIRRSLSPNDSIIDLTALVPKVLSEREKRAQRRSEKRDENDSNDSDNGKKARKRRREPDEEDDDDEGVSKRRRIEDRRGVKRRSNEEDDEGEVGKKRGRNEDGDDTNVTRRRARNIRRRCSALLIGSRQLATNQESRKAGWSFRYHQRAANNILRPSYITLLARIYRLVVIMIRSLATTTQICIRDMLIVRCIIQKDWHNFLRLGSKHTRNGDKYAPIS